MQSSTSPGLRVLVVMFLNQFRFQNIKAVQNYIGSDTKYTSAGHLFNDVVTRFKI